MIKIGYKIGGSFEDYCKEGSVGFEILFPHIYSSFEEAEKNNFRMSAMMKKQDDGEVVIILHENRLPVGTIHWDEWMKYKCNHLKREKIDAGFTDANTDYEPYSEKFEKIFDAYCGDNKCNDFHMQCLAYWVEPVIVTDDEDVCVA